MSGFPYRRGKGPAGDPNVYGIQHHTAENYNPLDAPQSDPDCCMWWRGSMTSGNGQYVIALVRFLGDASETSSPFSFPTQPPSSISVSRVL